MAKGDGGRAPIRPYGGVDFHGPKPGTPARAAALARHVNSLSSPNLGRQQGARHSLERMNLTPTEHMYVQSKVHEQSVSKPPRLPGFNPREAVAPNQKAMRRAVNEAQNAPRTSLGQVAEQITGYKEIEHIHQHPIAGGLALAGILPIGKVGKVLELGAEEARAVSAGAQVAKEGEGIKGFMAARKEAKAALRGSARTEKAAKAHVLEVSRKAKQQGFGRMLPKVPLLKPGEVSKETAGAAGAAVRQGLKNVGHERNVQEAERAIERSKRAGLVEGASSEGSGLARHIAAKTELQGHLPAGAFRGFKGDVAQNADELINHIYDHPHFQPYEKVSATDALIEGINGKVPTKSAQKLLERAFGKEQASGLLAGIKAGGIKDTIANIANVPRSIMASGDLSAPFRQGLVAMAARPDVFFSGFGPMLRAAKSEKFFQDAMGAIHKMPTFPLMEKGGLSLTDIGETAKGAENINKREEQFGSNLAEQIPGIGHMVRGSDRAYVLFLNHVRARLFNLYVHQAAEEGWHLNDKLVQDIAGTVNSMTGRGSLGKLTEHTAGLNALFFSPRLLASRLNFMNPVWYLRMSPFARRKALKAALNLAGTLSTTLFFAKMAGAKVVDDPRNADFGKIRIGNTRLDIAGGFTQPIRLIDQLYQGQVVSSTTGKVEKLSSNGFGRSRFDVAMQFLENKTAPVPSTIIDVLKGNQFGQGVSVKSELEQRMIPLLWQDMASIYHATGPKGLAAYGPEDLFGVGVQNYAPIKKKTRGSSGYGGGGQYGGSGEYGGSGSYGGSGAYG